MDMHDKVSAVLKLVCKLEEKRGRDPLRVYKSGNCGNLFHIFDKSAHLFSIFQAVLPQVAAYAVNGSYGSVEHIVTKIGEDFYDITGKLDSQDLKGKLSLASEQTLERCTNKYPLFSGWNKDACDKEKNNAEHTRKDLKIIQTYCKKHFGQ